MTERLFLSQPKSGRTWLRMMIDAAVHQKKAVRFKHPLRARFTWRDDIEYYLLVRHPFDVVVSWYYHQKHRQKGAEVNESIGEFIRTELPIILSRSQELYQNLWRYPLWIRYEDLVVDTPGTLTRVLDALGMPYNLEVGLAAGQWDVLRASERWRGPLLENARKFRKGKIGGYRELPKRDIAFMRTELAKYDPKEQWGYVS